MMSERKELDEEADELVEFLKRHPAAMSLVKIVVFAFVIYFVVRMLGII